MRLVKVGGRFINLDMLIQAIILGPESIPPASGEPTLRVVLQVGEALDIRGADATTLLAILDEMAGLGPPIPAGAEPEPTGPTGPASPDESGAAVSMDVQTGQPARRGRRRGRQLP